MENLIAKETKEKKETRTRSQNQVMQIWKECLQMFGQLFIYFSFSYLTRGLFWSGVTH